MAELNFDLLRPQPTAGASFVSGMMEGQQDARTARTQENQNALTQYTLSKAKREDELTNQLLGDLRSATTNDEIYRAYERAGKGDVASKLRGEALTQDKTRLEIAGIPGAQAKTAAETQKLMIEAKNKAIGEVAGFPDANSANAAIDAHLANKSIDQATADQMRQGLTPETFTQWKHDTLVRLSTPAEQLKQSAVTTKDTDRGGFIERQAYDAQGKAVGDPIMLPKTAAPSTDAAMLSAQAATRRWNPETLQFENVVPAGVVMRPPVAATPPVNAMATPPVNAMIPRPAAPAVVTPAGNLKPSPREIRDARMKGFTFNPDGSMTRIPGGPADKAAVERTPVQETKFKKDLANDYATVTATMQGMQDVLDSIADVRGSDISGATGLSSYIPTIPGGKTAQAETNLANLKGKITSLGQTIANQSGKVGPMAVQEWTIVRDMVSALDTAVKKGENITLDEINKIEFTAKNIAERIKNKYEGQYGDELSNYPQFATIPEPKSRIKGPIPIAPAAPKANAPAATPAPGWGRAVAK